MRDYIIVNGEKIITHYPGMVLPVSPNTETFVRLWKNLEYVEQAIADLQERLGIGEKKNAITISSELFDMIGKRLAALEERMNVGPKLQYHYGNLSEDKGSILEEETQPERIEKEEEKEEQEPDPLPCAVCHTPTKPHPLGYIPVSIDANIQVCGKCRVNWVAWFRHQVDEASKERIEELKKDIREALDE